MAQPITIRGTKQKKNQNNIKEINYPPKKILISLSSDSQGRYVRNKIEELSSGQINVFSYIRANTTLIQILDLALKEKDNKPLILLGGTNDSLKNNLYEVYEKLESKLELLSKRRPVFLTTILPRYDQPMISPTNYDLEKLNNYIIELVSRLKNVFLINLSEVKRFHFTQHGLHLNKQGKLKLAKMIIKAINRQNKVKTFLNLSRDSRELPRELFSKVKYPCPPEKNSAFKNNNISNDKNRQSKISVDSRSIKMVTNEPTIRTINADMKDVINKYCKQKDIAFAHCISADFESDRQMTAGVAVTFKNKFGKPLISDCVNERLAHQNTKDGAGVYSLITKPQYYQKPHIDTYNAAFKDLTEDFNIKGYKHLICSPMGCVRDLIQIEDFIKNLLTFQSNTAANISIVVYNESSKRALMNGLSFDEFVNKIWCTIASEIEKVRSLRTNDRASSSERKTETNPHPATVQAKRKPVPNNLEMSHQLRSMVAFPPLTTSSIDEVRDGVAASDYIMDYPSFDKSLDNSRQPKDANSFL